MTQEELIKFWELIVGYRQGRKLQIWDEYNKKWFDLISPTFKLNDVYRFKEEPVYVPFDFSDAEELIGRPIKQKDGLVFAALITYVNIQGVWKRNGFIDYIELFKDYTFLDGSVCGKLKQ